MATFGTGNFSTTLPALTATPVWGSADAASTLPHISQSAAGGLAWSASLTFGKLTSATEDQGGYSVSSTFPILTSDGVMLTGGVGYAASVFPALVGLAEGERGGFASSTLPILASSAIGYAEVIFSPNTVFPHLQMAASVEAILTELFNVWVMDAVSKGVSKYTDYHYNSFGKRDGVYFGANDNGIYRLDAETDSGVDIDAQLLFAPTGFYYEGADFGLSREEATKQKRSASIYLVCRNDGDLNLLVKVDEDKYRAYVVDSSSDPQGMHNRRIVPGRGLKGVLWQFGISNQNGADFELAAIKAYPIVLSRRV